jgi:hypothetical protein
LAHDLDRHEQTIRIGRAIDPALAYGQRWSDWEAVLLLVLDSARQIHDPEAEAWALHQLGTRSLCSDDRDAARAALEEALTIRRQLDDLSGVAASAHNLAEASRRTLWVGKLLNRGMLRVPATALAVVGVALVFTAAGVSAGLIASSGGNGSSGVRGPTGAPGPRGSTGPRGGSGPTGPSGAAGSTGARGAKGPAGVAGAKGPTGVAGAKGPTGDPGAQGPTGAKGPTGSPG